MLKKMWYFGVQKVPVIKLWCIGTQKFIPILHIIVWKGWEMPTSQAEREW